MLSKITELWPSAVIYPQKNQINVVSADAFTKPTQKRIDYIRDTSEIQMTQDSTNIVNMVRCIGATKQSDTSTAATDSGGVQLTESEATQTTGVDRTAEFQADAKKYLACRTSGVDTISPIRMRGWTARVLSARSTTTSASTCHRKRHRWNPTFTRLAILSVGMSVSTARTAVRIISV